VAENIKWSDHFTIQNMPVMPNQGAAGNSESSREQAADCPLEFMDGLSYTTIIEPAAAVVKLDVTCFTRIYNSQS